MSLPPQIEAKIDKAGPVPERRPDLGPCWQWTGALGAGGYGMLTLAQTSHRAHVFTYVDSFGPVPAGLELDHLCERKSCVRPSHLEAVTHAENCRRHHMGKETCKNGHPWTEENTWRSPSHGRRGCRACNRENQRRRYRSKAGKT